MNGIKKNRSNTIPTMIHLGRILTALENGGSLNKSELKLSSSINGAIFDKSIAFLVSRKFVLIHKTKSKGLKQYRLNPVCENGDL